MDIFLVKRGLCLIAEDPFTIQQISKIKEGVTVEVKTKVPRSLQFHKLFFALLNLVYENQREPAQFATAEGMLDAIKIAVGHVREIRDLQGRTHFIPKSIDFASLDQTEFKEFFDAAVNVILNSILPNSTRQDLEQQCYTILGLGGPSQLER